MNIPLTAPQTSRIRPMPPPKEEASFAARLFSSPVTSPKASSTAWAQLLSDKKSSAANSL